jgi:hypothetical protein
VEYTSWSTTTNWTAGHAPISTDQVVFGPALANISLSTGSYTADSIGSDVNIVLTQSGGSLTVDSDFSIVNGNSSIGSHPVLYS